MPKDPTTKYPQPPQPEQKQPIPGYTDEMSPTPDHGEKTYKGHGRLDGRAALVTGADSGIGRAVAIAFAREGADVLISYLEEHEDAKETARWVEEAGRKAVVVAGDIQDEAHCKSLVERTREEFGAIDILVNNAGIQHVAPVHEFPPERWDAVIAINLSSAFHATRLALPAMRAANWGRVINVASVHGLVASAEKAAYVAAKHGLVGLTKVVALENATTGVTCNAICPGWVLTPLVQKQVDARAAANGISNDEATRQLLGEKEPSLQFTTPEELGELAVFFCSPAANNVRGVAWNMDGGWAAQ
jgi:3-hydroxybutyrate dehydrogenase